ncbi:MAG: hypothetical protein K8G78_07535, partial [Deltaproteobacteria bacterium]|nr:hypothetical protein [Candidatus Kapabacteria bacterium]
KSTTWYVRDAQGNTLATYTKPADSSTARQHEVMLYGSTRLAVAETQAPYSDSETDTLGIFDRVSSRTLGTKRYELTDHLGNVRATVTDVVIDHSGDLDAELSTRTDYYPFGMIMGGRNSSADDAHRYGFNGKENDNEVKGEGVQQDYGFRIYDARLARFLSVDPLTKNYPSWSPYPFAMNRVIDGVDLDGLEFYAVNSASQQQVLGFIEEQFGSSSGFSWTDKGKLRSNASELQRPTEGTLRRELFDEFMQVVNAVDRPVLFDGTYAMGQSVRVQGNVESVITAGQRRTNQSIGVNISGAPEGFTTTVGNMAAFVVLDPIASNGSAGRYDLVGGGKSDPCVSCVFFHEILDHVLPWMQTGSPDQPGSTNRGDYVRRHSDMLNNIGQPGRRSGGDHDNPGNLPLPSGPGSNGNSGSEQETPPSQGGGNNTPEPVEPDGN